MTAEEAAFASRGPLKLVIMDLETLQSTLLEAAPSSLTRRVTNSSEIFQPESVPEMLLGRQPAGRTVPMHSTAETGGLNRRRRSIAAAARGPTLVETASRMSEPEPENTAPSREGDPDSAASELALEAWSWLPKKRNPSAPKGKATAAVLANTLAAAAISRCGLIAVQPEAAAAASAEIPPPEPLAVTAQTATTAITGMSGTLPAPAWRAPASGPASSIHADLRTAHGAEGERALTATSRPAVPAQSAASVDDVTTSAAISGTAAGATNITYRRNASVRNSRRPLMKLGGSMPSLPSTGLPASAAWPASGTDRSSAFRETLAALIEDEAPGLPVMPALPERAALSGRRSLNRRVPMATMSFLEAGTRPRLLEAGRQARQARGEWPSEPELAVAEAAGQEWGGTTDQERAQVCGSGGSLPVVPTLVEKYSAASSALDPRLHPANC